jgi:hypothetical protein
MSRQQKRAKVRAISKTLRRKLPKSAVVSQIMLPVSSMIVSGTVAMTFEALSDRQRKGYELWQAAMRENARAIVLTDAQTMWRSGKAKNVYYRVVCMKRNHRGTMRLEFECDCPDMLKNGNLNCKHIVADQLRRGAIVVTTPVKRKAAPQKLAERRPARKRKNSKGRAIRTSQRDARVNMPSRIPELAVSLAKAYHMFSTGIVVPITTKAEDGGRSVTPHVTRALALLYKIAEGRSADAMIEPYKRLIADRKLLLEGPPHQNSITHWMNDPRLTPVLRELLRLTSLPFRLREIGGIIDSSKVSQLRTVHAKRAVYDNEDRAEADWMKCHAIVGVETMVVMDVIFGGSRGDDTGDVAFMKPLVDSALRTFNLEFMLADMAYINADMLTWLKSRNLKAAIPIRSGWFEDAKKWFHHDAVMEHVKWFTKENNKPFHEVYRLRTKIEALFSILKRVSQEHCWSRGRKNKEAKNSDQPCVAWQNETLCKFIYLNLRTTVTLEKETGYIMDYTRPSLHFPAPDEPLLNRSMAA